MDRAVAIGADRKGVMSKRAVLAILLAGAVTAGLMLPILLDSEHPVMSEMQKRRVMAAFLDKFALDEALEEEIDIPGWTADLVDEITELYEEDVFEMQRIPGVGLDPVPRRALQLRRRHDLAPDPGRGQRPIQPEAGRAGLVGHRHRPRQIRHP